MRILLIIFVISLCSCTDGKKSQLVVNVEDFRIKGLSDDQVIQKAIDEAGEGGAVAFERSRVYVIGNALFVKPFQRLVGNNATLKRADQTFVFLKASTPANSRNLVVDSVPSGWKIGDQMQVFTDSTSGFSNDFGDYPLLPNIITDISRDTITLSTPVGPSQNKKIMVWPVGATVRKVFSILRGDSINVRSVPFTVTNLNFDGNRGRNNQNFFWNVNSTIFMRGQGGKIEDCRFRNIPNEAIVGQGFFVTNCQAQSLNGSFIHLAGSDSVKEYRQRNAIITGNTVVGVCQIAPDVTGHSEAVFTTSHNGGFVTIADNRIYDSGEAAFGVVDGHLSVEDGGKSDVLITGNLFKNCKKIFHYIKFSPAGSTVPIDIYVTGNIFSNCGENDWTGESDWGTLHSGIQMGENSYTNGTKWIIKTNKPKKGF